MLEIILVRMISLLCLPGLRRVSPALSYIHYRTSIISLYIPVPVLYISQYFTTCSCSILNKTPFSLPQAPAIPQTRSTRSNLGNLERTNYP